MTTVTTAIVSASISTGVSLPLLTAIAQQSSTLGQDVNSLTPNASGAVGVMQLTPAILQILKSTGYSVNPYDVNSNVTGAAIYVEQLLAHYNGNQQAAIAAYSAGTALVDLLLSQYGVNFAAHLPTTTANFLTGVSSAFANNNVASGSPVQPTFIPTLPSPLPPFVSYETFPETVDPVANTDISSDQLAAIQPPLVVTNSDGKPYGLDSTPWWQDAELITGNPRLKKLGTGGFPITFEVFMDQNNPHSLLTTTNSAGTPIPITIPLNCSLENFHVSSRHVMNASPTRTGFHITMWGMAADIIEGSGSTGVFMNQFGLTDFLSLSGVPSSAVLKTFQSYALSPSSTAVADENGQQVVHPKTPLLSNLQKAQDLQQLSVNSALSSFNLPTEPYRIAAEDAFQEFLALFKMNGTTWLHPSGYGFDSENAASDIVNQNQTAVYSQTVGANDFEIKARNNDVYRRGYVVMKFRNSQYLGFFKSLSWAMDANDPYQWKFSFVFQVERTLSLVYFANPQISTTAVAAALNVSSGG